MAQSLVHWAGSVLSQRKIQVNSIEDLRDGNYLLHLWELIGTKETENYVPGHELVGGTATQAFSLLLQSIPVVLKKPEGDVRDSFIELILESLLCCAVARTVSLVWNFLEKRTLDEAKSLIFSKLTSNIQSDLGMEIGSIGAL